MLDFAISLDGLGKYIQDIENLPEKQRMAIIRAVNRTAERFRTSAQRKMLENVNLTATYLNERLTVSRRAAGRQFEATISGRSRPTSLARFITKEIPHRGVNVAVKPGVARFIDRSFVFKGGKAKQNRLLAVRTSGGPPRGAYKPSRLSDNLWLVFGPSVDQLLRQELKTGELVEQAADFLEAEYLRLMDLEHF